MVFGVGDNLHLAEYNGRNDAKAPNLTRDLVFILLFYQFIVTRIVVVVANNFRFSYYVRVFQMPFIATTN